MWRIHSRCVLWRSIVPKKYINKTAYKTYMCQKCTAALGNTELVYKPPIDTDDEESESNMECDKLSKTIETVLGSGNIQD
eukprot:12898911-Ditylum_brightwellii.AAC.1